MDLRERPIQMQRLAAARHFSVMALGLTRHCRHTVASSLSGVTGAFPLLARAQMATFLFNGDRACNALAVEALLNPEAINAGEQSLHRQYCCGSRSDCGLR